MASKAPRKTQAKKSAAKKSAAKKSAAKKSVTKKPAAKKSVAKKLAAKRPAARKPAAKKPAPGVRSVEQAMDEWLEAWPKMVARAWSDEAFKNRLLQEPEKVARDREWNLHVENNFRIQVREGTTPPTLLINIPPRPEGLPVTEDLAKDAVERKTCNNGCSF